MNYSEISRCAVVDEIFKSRSEAGKLFIAMARTAIFDTLLRPWQSIWRKEHSLNHCINLFMKELFSLLMFANELILAQKITFIILMCLYTTVVISIYWTRHYLIWPFRVNLIRLTSEWPDLCWLTIPLFRSSRTVYFLQSGIFYL